MISSVASSSSSKSQGILFVTLGMGIFSIQDVVIKQFSEGYPVLQIVFIRSVVALFLLLLLAHYRGGLGQLRTKRLGAQLLRGLLLLTSYTTYYLSFAAMPLVDAVAIFFVAPIFVTLFSVLILREKVAWKHWAAISVGFLGTLVILRPGSSVFEPAALFSVAAALAYALSVIINRRLGSSESGVSLAIYATGVYLVGSGIWGLLFQDGLQVATTHPSVAFLVRSWVFPNSIDFMLMCMIGVISAVGFYCLAQAYRIAEAATVAPFEYVMLILGTLWGYLLWREIPDLPTILGALLIIGSGLLLLPRRRRRRWILRR